jgi:hypothetical protein
MPVSVCAKRHIWAWAVGRLRVHMTTIVTMRPSMQPNWI